MDDVRLYFYLNGDLTPEEQKEVEKWIADNPEHFARIRLIWENSKRTTQNEKPDLIKAWKNINPEKYSHSLTRTGPNNGHFRQLLKAAAILLLAIGLGTIGYNIHLKQNHSEWTSYTAKNEMNKEVMLPDGSKIWLNKESVLYYPMKFKKGIREVRLEGEAFFEVAHNENKPFVVRAGNTYTKVLGTSFNINACDTSKAITVTVVSGKVAFCNTKITGQQVILAKGEEGVYSAKGEKIFKQLNHNKNFIAWKTGMLIFNNSALPEVCNVLSHHFDTVIFIRQPQLLNQHLTARFQDKSLNEVLDALKMTFNIDCLHKEKGIELVAN